MARHWRRIPRPLLLLQAVALVQVVAWSLALPPLQGPDEVWHAAYVQHLAETGDAPSRTGGARQMSTEQGALFVGLDLAPSVGVATALPARTARDRARWEDEQAGLSEEARSDGSGPNPMASNPPLYYAWEALAYLLASPLDLIDRLFVMKVANALLYLATIAFAWLLAGEVFPRRRDLQTLATAAIVLLPQLAWLSAHLNPDTLLVTLWSAFFWLAARVLRRGPSIAGLAALGAVAAAAALTHGRGLALLVPTLAVLALAAYKARRSPRLVFAGAAVAVAAMAGALGFAYEWTQSSGGAAFGGEVARSAGGVGVAGFLSYLWQFYLPRLGFMGPAPGPDYGFREVFVEGFFGTFASLEVRYPDWVYDVLQVGWLVGLVAVCALLVRRRAGGRLVAVFLVAAASLMLLLHRVAYQHLADGSGDPIIQGRYVLPFAALFALGVAVLARFLPPRAARAFAAAVVVAGSLLHVAGLGLTFARFYG